MFVSVNRSLKAKAAAGKKRASVSRESSSESGGGTSALQSVPKPLGETTERQALSFFFSEFVALPRHQDTARGFIEYLLPIYSDARRNSPLLDATAAAALAALSHKRRSQQLMVHSHMHYGKAVTALQEAIGDPNIAKSNETLMSIMILGLFEAMTATESSLFEWGHHADGATALVQYRGSEEMLAEPMSRKMYWAVRGQALYNNIIKNEALEPHLDFEQLWAEPVELPRENHAIKLTALCVRIPALRAAAFKWLRAPMSGSVAIKCLDIIGHCKVMDQLLAAWAFEAPSIWSPRSVGSVEGIITDPQDTFLYPGSLDSYYDLWTSSIWNTYRIMRTICQNIIINCLERLYPAEDLFSVPEYETAATIIQSMTNSVCASVPYNLGHPMPLFDEAEAGGPRSAAFTRDDTRQPRYRPEDPAADRAVKTLGAYWILLPLFFGAASITLPETQRAWLRGRLIYIAKTHGTGQAQVLADLTPVSIHPKRQGSVMDFCPPAYVPYPDVFELMASPSFRNLEAIAELQAQTVEARLFRAWRTGFLKRLLDM